MLVPASFAVPSLTMICVYACSCVGMCISYACESLRFEGGSMVVMFCDSAFHLRNCERSAVQ